MEPEKLSLAETGGWAELLAGEAEKPYFSALSEAVAAAYRAGTVYPPRDALFSAFRLTPPEALRAVILGQDPYPGPGQAHGLSFSVPPGTALPRSLQNIYRELSDDLGVPAPESGCLLPWAEQGVFLLNSFLTVEAGRPGSHRSLGWETFTDAVISAVADLPQPVAFLLWGNQAIRKAPLTESRAPRLLLKSAHPSPLSARRGFFGSRPFSKINAFLEAYGEAPIRWSEREQPVDTDI